MEEKFYRVSNNNLRKFISEFGDRRVKKMGETKNVAYWINLFRECNIAELEDDEIKSDYSDMVIMLKKGYVEWMPYRECHLYRDYKHWIKNLEDGYE